MTDKREQFGEALFYFVLVLWISTEVLFNSTLEKFIIWKIDEANDVFAVMVLALLIIKLLLLQKYSIRDILVVGVISIPIVLATLNSGHNKMLSTWIFIVAAKKTNFDKSIKLAYYAQLVTTIIVLWMFFNGYINDVTIYRGHLLRHSLGFSHPNQLGMRIFMLVTCHCYLRKDKVNLFDALLVLGAGLFVNKVANSKTAYYSLVIFAFILLIHIIVRRIGINSNTFSNVWIIIAFLANAVSLLLTIVNVKHYNFLKVIDKYMSQRFFQCHRTLQYYGIKLFGQEVHLLVNKGMGRTLKFWLDNAYIAILVRYGIVVFILFTAMYLFTMARMKEYNNIIVLEILCLYAIYGIMENNYFSMSNNLFLLTIASFVFRDSTFTEKNSPRKRVVFSW